MFLIDKYTPHNIQNIFFHKQICELLKIMSSDNEIPHIIFYGPEGSGKRTLINIFLEMLFDDTIYDINKVKYTVASSGNKVSDELIEQSNYHIVLEPYENNYDRYLIHDIVKKYSLEKSLNVYKSNRNFKIIVINNVDNLYPSAQFSLRRTMEDNSDNCRFIMWCKSLSKVIKPLASRCVCLKIPAPTDIELLPYILSIASKENIPISLDKMTNILTKSNGNIKTVLWLLQIYKNNTLYLQFILSHFPSLSFHIQQLYNLQPSSLILPSYDELTLNLSNTVDNFEFVCNTNNINSIIDKLYLPIKLYLTFLTKSSNFQSYDLFITNSDSLLILNINNLQQIILNIKNIFLDIINLLSLLDSHTNLEYEIKKLIDIILNKDINDIPLIRDILFNLIITNIKNTNIITLIINELLLSNLPSPVLFKLITLAANVESNVIKGRRDIIHLDYFIINIFDILSTI